ncbi:MAG: phenylalanine--tRNA ligase beta subunit-related protein [Acidobacteriota bacterium]
MEARGCRAGPSPSPLLSQIDRAVAAAVEEEARSSNRARKAAVRDLLRFGAYKPTGRAKPASEYLLREAVEGRFPRINTLADINNLVSLETLLPISLVDVEAAGGCAFRVRRGREAESYAFNASGQVIDLRDLLLVARLPSDLPCASPVKDSQATKTHAGTRRALGIVYAPRALAAEAKAAAGRMADLMARFAAAEVTWGHLGEEREP